MRRSLWVVLWPGRVPLFRTARRFIDSMPHRRRVPGGSGWRLRHQVDNRGVGRRGDWLDGAANDMKVGFDVVQARETQTWELSRPADEGVLLTTNEINSKDVDGGYKPRQISRSRFVVSASSSVPSHPFTTSLQPPSQSCLLTRSHLSALSLPSP